MGTHTRALTHKIRFIEFYPISFLLLFTLFIYFLHIQMFQIRILKQQTILFLNTNIKTFLLLVIICIWEALIMKKQICPYFLIQLHA